MPCSLRILLRSGTFSSGWFSPFLKRRVRRLNSLNAVNNWLQLSTDVNELRIITRCARVQSRMPCRQHELSSSGYSCEPRLPCFRQGASFVHEAQRQHLLRLGTPICVRVPPLHTTCGAWQSPSPYTCCPALAAWSREQWKMHFLLCLQRIWKHRDLCALQSHPSILLVCSWSSADSADPWLCSSEHGSGVLSPSRRYVRRQRLQYFFS